MPKKWSRNKANIGILDSGIIRGFLSGPEMVTGFFYIGHFNVDTGLVAIAALLVAIVGDWE